MSQEIRQTDVQEKTQQLMEGPLKHIRAAALAAALLPLASVMATPADAQTTFCASAGTTGGRVFDDVNKDGIQDALEPGIGGAKVSLFILEDSIETYTDLEGYYSFVEITDGTFRIAVPIAAGTQPSPANVGFDDFIDSDGESDTIGASVALASITTCRTDFGFFTTPKQQPGTGTPGYWKNHPEAWPLPGVTVGGVYYTKAQAISWLGKVGKDKMTTMFSSLVPAMLNVAIGNDRSCVDSTIAAANAWMATYGPFGINIVPASSDAWTIGEPMHQQMDAYNNGRLCAPHRN